MTSPRFVQTSTVVKSIASMTSQERCPGCLSFAIRYRFDAVVPQYVANGGVRDGVAQAGQSILDSVVARSPKSD